VIHAWSLDATRFDGTTLQTLDADLQRVCVSALHLAQALVRAGLRDTPRLFLLTRGAQAVREGEMTEAVQAPLWGLGRTIALEHPELACTRVDLDSRPASEEVSLVMNELLAADREDQVALRENARYVARLVRGRLEEDGGGAMAARLPARGRPFRLAQPAPGILERLELSGGSPSASRSWPPRRARWRRTSSRNPSSSSPYPRACRSSKRRRFRPCS
jgi:hypothetical protein